MWNFRSKSCIFSKLKLNIIPRNWFITAIKAACKLFDNYIRVWMRSLGEKKFHFLMKFWGRRPFPEMENRAAAPAHKTVFENLFGPPSCLTTLGYLWWPSEAVGGCWGRPSGLSRRRRWWARGVVVDQFEDGVDFEEISKSENNVRIVKRVAGQNIQQIFDAKKIWHEWKKSFSEMVLNYSLLVGWR